MDTRSPDRERRPEPAGAQPTLEAAEVEAARGGDRRAIAAVLARHEDAVYRLGLRFCKDPEDAREVLQETLLAAARGLPSYRGEATIATWLYTIARSFCIKQRRRRRVPSIPLDGPDDQGIDLADPRAHPDEVAMDHELGAALQTAIDGLGPPYRDVLVLRDVEGLTAPEVAAALGIGIDAVKSRLHRARMAIREKLAPVVGAAPPAPPGCPDVVSLFSRKLEGEVDAHLCEQVERHLAGCPRCAAACDDLRRTLALCASARGASVPPSIQASVRRAVRDLLRLEGGDA
jgi:RNA polymerase sigma-70 factor (ECF subfamily)